MAEGEMIRAKSRDGFEFAAYHVEPTGPRKGGVIVIQEIFGISDHVKEMTERFGAAGYEAIAPSMYDRAAPGFIVQAKDTAANMPKARAKKPRTAARALNGGGAPATTAARRVRP